MFVHQHTEGSNEQAWFIDRGMGKAESTPKRKKGMPNGLDKSEAPEVMLFK